MRFFDLWGYPTDSKDGDIDNFDYIYPLLIQRRIDGHKNEILELCNYLQRKYQC
jgi:hypothetical protein